MAAVYKTGIRSGELITSTIGAKQNAGTVMRIRGEYPVSAASIPNSQEEWLIRSEELSSIPFFTDMTLQDRATWLLSHTTSNSDLYLSDPSTNIFVKFLSINGQYMLESLSPENITMLLAGNPQDPEGYWDIHYVYGLFPKKAGSKARRHTLVFRPSNWRVIAEDAGLSKTGYLTIDVDNSTISPYYNSSGKLNIMFQTYSEHLPIKSYSIVVNKRNEAELYDVISLFQLISERTGSSVNVLQEIRANIKFFTPAVHKSLIQKVIRTGARTVTHGQRRWSGEDVLLVSFIMLLTSPGSFVPDLQKFVTGAESALKRLAVSICEDSSLTNYSAIMSLLAGAMIASKDSSWKPTNSLLCRWIDAAVEAYNSKTMYIYENRMPDNYRILDWNERSGSYFLLTELKSFATDLCMLASIDANLAKVTFASELFDSMPLIHCIDQHSLTEIAYYYSYKTVKAYGDYSKLFYDLWGKVTGVNPRKERYATYWRTMESDPFVIETRAAQTYIWVAKTQLGSIERKKLDTKYNLQYTLHESTLAGLIGPIEVRVGNTTIMVVNRPDINSDLMAIRKPSRDDKQEIQLTEDERTSAIHTVSNMLANGHKLDIPNSLFWMKGAIVYRQMIDGNVKYILSIDGKYVNWEIYRQISFLYSENDYLEPNIWNAITTSGSGVSVNADSTLLNILQTTNIQVLSRFLSYLASPTSVIEMNKMSRKGVGQEYTTVPEDSGVFNLLCSLSVLYPSYISLKDTRKFVIIGPGMLKIKDIISGYYSSSTNVSLSAWTPIHDTINRRLWDHQIETVNYMKNRFDRSRRGSIIWIPVGLGKTLIVLTYIAKLIEENKMPLYCIYTLPPSAIDSISREISFFGLQVHIIDMRKDTADFYKNPVTKAINIIPHDTLRLVPWLTSIAANTLFIIDEFHKTLNKTQRTSTALELARLSYDFVAMSGTIATSDNVEDLIQWLKQIVDFEVTEKNFWVAIGAMISRKVSTKLIINRILDEATMSEIDRNRYKELSDNTRMSNTQFIEVINICRRACSGRMVQLVIYYLGLGERVFLVAKNKQNAEEFRSVLYSNGITNIFVIGIDGMLTLRPGENTHISVVITTPTHNAGYSLSTVRVMITSVYFTNQSVRDQLEGRITRIDSIGPEVNIITVTAGLLSQVFARYERARSLSAALKEFADDVGVELL
jgi:hypothetical protein